MARHRALSAALAETLDQVRAVLAVASRRLYRRLQPQDSASDPIQIVRPFSRSGGSGGRGFCAAALAFGRVASVLNSIDTLFALHGPAPGRLRAALRARSAASAGMRAMVHRWIRGDGSRRAALDPAADAGAVGFDRALLPRRLSRRRTRTSAPRSTAFRRARWRSTSGAPTAAVPRRPGVCYFFPRPSAGSALQAAEPVPALDGADRRSGPRRLDATCPPRS